MIKVLFICSNLIIGGVEKVCWEIVSNINKSKYHIDFFVAIDSNIEQYYEPLLIEKGCRIYKGGYIRNSEDKKKFLEKEQELLQLNHYDIVHSHMDFMNIWTLRVAKKQGIKKRISHVHTSFPDKKGMSMMDKCKYFLQCTLMQIYANIRIGCSKLANDSFYPYITSEVIKNGFDIKPYLKCGQSNKKIKKNIVIIGRITPEKNPLFVCEIMHELVKLDSEFVLFWIGDGYLRQKVEEMIDGYSLRSNIHLIGATTNVFPYLEMCSVAICPSIYEGLGISVVETQLAKCFTFYSNVIPNEANIGYAKELPLTMGAKAWATYIYDYTMHDKYFHFNLDVERAKQYDIHNVIQRWEAIYSKNSYTKIDVWN